MTTVAVLPTWVRFAKMAPRVCGARSTAALSCPGRVQRGEAERRTGTQEYTKRNIVCRLRSVVSPLGPGSRCARPGHECAKSRRAQSEPLAIIPIHDVKQRSVVRSRGALLRPGLCVSSQVPSLLRPPASPRGFGASGRRDSSDSVPPMRGDGAPTGALFLSVAPATRDHPVPGRPGPLSALHRGGFRMRTHEAGSR